MKKIPTILNVAILLAFSFFGYYAYETMQSMQSDIRLLEISLERQESEINTVSGHQNNMYVVFVWNIPVDRNYQALPVFRKSGYKIIRRICHNL